jgi:cell wall-associated NlpC family hydrolase
VDLPRTARLTVVAALCASFTCVAAVTPAQAGRIADTRAQADRAWAQIQRDGERLERVVERSNGARLRLAQTQSAIRNNQTVLVATRINLARSESALSASLISAYKSPVPDPLQAALQARNFGEVLEQFALLDRTNTYNANMLRAIRVYRGEIVRRQRLLTHQREERQAALAQLQSLRTSIRSSMLAEKQRYRGLRAEVRRLIVARRQAEIAASRSAAAKAQALGANAANAPVAANDIGGVSSVDGPSAAAVPAPSSGAASAVTAAIGELGVPYVPGGASPAGFDCSGLVSWAYAQAGHPGLPHYSGALWNAGTRITSPSELAPGDLVFFNSFDHVGMYIGGGQFVEAPHSGDVVKVSNLADRSDYLGGVRIAG